MMIWGLILLGIAIGRLLDNALGSPGNVWGNIITVIVALIILVIAVARKGMEIERNRQQYPGQ